MEQISSAVLGVDSKKLLGSQLRRPLLSTTLCGLGEAGAPKTGLESGSSSSRAAISWLEEIEKD